MYSYSSLSEMILHLDPDRDIDVIITFLRLTGMNVCVTLCDGLNHICIYKDSFTVYRDVLEDLLSEISRLILTIGPSTELLVRLLFISLKNYNETYRKWKFERKNIQAGKDAIEHITNTLKEYHFEGELFMIKESCFHNLFANERNGHISSEALFDDIDYYDDKKYRNIVHSLRSSYDTLTKKQEWDQYCIWKCKPEELQLHYENKDTSKRETNKMGRFYCSLQKLLIKKINDAL